MDSANEVAWEVWEASASQIRTAGMGTYLGVDFNVLPFVLSTLSVPKSEWEITLHKLLVVQKVAIKLQQKTEERNRAAKK